ncbi:MAG: homoserine O-acetyltransferase [Sphingobacteriales bacterium]|nr:MAG: homoserine O-acetyltransferase [Sphingobacteriales bacterium]
MQYTFTTNEAFVFENGQSLPSITIAYSTLGTLNAAKDNVVWVCHALTANASADDWWSGIVGTDSPINPEQHYIVCANIIGSCYGSTGPLSNDPASGKPYYQAFPDVTIRDMVQAHQLLREHLGIERIHILAGGSMGGYQVLEWAIMEPHRIGNLFLLATSAAESAWGIAIHTTQRLAIEADQTFGEARPDAGAKGLKAARAVGLLTYRNYALMVQQQSDDDADKRSDFKASSYINYQGDKLVARFNAYSYHTLTQAMDSHNIARGRATTAAAMLAGMQQPTLLIAISSDILCPPQEQWFMAEHLPHCQCVEIDSQYGHDGFLVESGKIGAVLREWMMSLA